MVNMEAIPTLTFMGNRTNLTSLLRMAMSVSTAKTVLSLPGTNTGDHSIPLT